MLLLIDNYDSFTYNLFHYLGELGAAVEVRRNDKVSVAEVMALHPQAIILSPGPCDPDRAGICLELIQAATGKLPILGVCLGHQAIGQVFGGKVVRGPVPMHGKLTAVQHQGEGIFEGIPSPFMGTRYHSLIVDRDSLPSSLVVTAETESGLIMGMAHRTLPIHGVQFHPESIASEQGHRLLGNFLKLAGLNTPAQGRGVSDLKPLIAAVAGGRSLDESEAEEAFDILMSGDATPTQIGAFLMALRVRGETVAEITGAVRTMRAKMLKIDAPDGAIDTCGTGGDNSGTLNISTGAAIVTAAAGVPVAKHGNRAASSKTGTADVLGALGVNIDADMALIREALWSANICFLMATRHHNAMRHVGPSRVELGTRTIFNLMGPLSNPAGARLQLLGVFAQTWIEPLAQVLASLGTERAWVVHGSDGLDEITTTGPTYVAELKGGKVSLLEVTPEMAGLRRATPADLKGADAATNAAAITGLLAGEAGPYRDIVLLNSAAALVLAGKATDLESGVALAASAIDSGKAKATLAELVAITNRAPAA